MSYNNSIGFFDSGIGGTSIWKAVNTLLPNENTIYLADSKNAPYGLKSKEEIIQLCYKNTDFLLKQNCKIIVVACNTATTNAIKELRHKYNIPFIGIEPAIKPAASNSKTHKIGILATKGTITSDLFHEKIKLYNNIQIIEQIGFGLVELIESGQINSFEMKTLLIKYLTPMVEQNIDYLVLGCSHYPYLIPQIRQILPSQIQIIDSGEAVAKQTKKILEQHNLLNGKEALSPQYYFYSNANLKVLQDVVGFQKNTFLQFNL